jgi:hypothetical protein
MTLSDAQKARLRLLEVAGGITPELVVADAQSPASPLHSLFEWNDGAAAHQWRLQQARRVLSVRYVYHEESTHTLATPRYVRNPSMPGNQQGYIAIPILRTNVEMARLTVKRELERAEAALIRALAIAEALDLTAGIADLISRLHALKIIAVPPIPPTNDHSGDGDNASL